MKRERTAESKEQKAEEAQGREQAVDREDQSVGSREQKAKSREQTVEQRDVSLGCFVDEVYHECFLKMFISGFVDPSCFSIPSSSIAAVWGFAM